MDHTEHGRGKGTDSADFTGISGSFVNEACWRHAGRMSKRQVGCNCYTVHTCKIEALPFFNNKCLMPYRIHVPLIIQLYTVQYTLYSPCNVTVITQTRFNASII